MWRLDQVAKIACLAETGAVFKLFQFFPRTFVTVHFLFKLSSSQTLRESSFSNPIDASFLIQIIKKRYGFYFLNLIFLFLHIFVTVWTDIAFGILISLCNGYGVSCWILFSPVFMLSSPNVFFIVLFFAYY